MLKNNEKRKSIIKYTFILETIMIVIVTSCISVLFSANGSVINVLQFIGSKIHAVYPFPFFWLFMFKGAITETVALIGLGIILFVYRLINILFLAKRKIFAIISTGVFYVFDTVCVLIAFFTSNQGSGTEYFGFELMSVVATIVTSFLMFILLRELYKQREKQDSEKQSGDGKEK